MTMLRGAALAWSEISNWDAIPHGAQSSVIMEREWPGAAAGGGGWPGAGVLVMAVWLVT